MDFLKVVLKLSLSFISPVTSVIKLPFRSWLLHGYFATSFPIPFNPIRGTW